MKGPLFALVLAITAFASTATQINGQVLGVADGDTVTILDAGKAQHKVRLAGIDAPEKLRPSGSDLNSRSAIWSSSAR